MELEGKLLEPRVTRGRARGVAWLLVAIGAMVPGEPAHAQPTPPPAPPAVELAPAPKAAPAQPTDPTRGDRMRAYHDAMVKRRLGSQEGVVDRLSERVAEAETLISSGRQDEAIAKLTE